MKSLVAFSLNVNFILKSLQLRRRQKQYYDTDDYDEDTVYYRHVPLRASDINNAYIMDDLEDEEEEEFLGEF